MKIRLATRAQARRTILAKWKRVIAQARRVRLPFHLPDWDRLRNYEIEDLLARVLGGAWCVSEWCPYDSIFCLWNKHAPVVEREKKIAKLEANRSELSTRIDVDYYITILRTKR